MSKIYDNRIIYEKLMEHSDEKDLPCMISCDLAEHGHEIETSVVNAANLDPNKMKL